MLTATAAHAQSIGGRVVDDATGAGLDGVELTAVPAAGGDTVRAVTNDSGEFVLRLPFGAAGRHMVSASRIGYRAVEAVVVLEGNERADIMIRLSVSAVAIDALTVTARGIEDRHRATWEGFLARRANRPNVGNILIMDRSDRVFDTAYDIGRVVQWLPSSGSISCIRVFVDGHTSLGLGWSTVSELSPERFEAIEFYRRGIDAPLEFRDATPCSVAVLWHRLPGRRVPPPQP